MRKLNLVDIIGKLDAQLDPMEHLDARIRWFFSDHDVLLEEITEKVRQEGIWDTSIGS